MACGATDYLVKGRTTADQLTRSIRYGIQHKDVERRLAELAQYDALTGLANRSMFNTRLADAIAQAKRTKLDMVLLLLDLDRFKDVNDTMGHPVGDLLLKAVSARLTGVLRETDVVARLSGDEFAIIATNLSHTRDAAELAHKIIDELARPYDLGGKDVTVSASVGVSLFGGDVESTSQLLSDADAALYQAKKSGRGVFRFFGDEMNKREQARKALEIDLHQALDGGQLFLHFQPKLDIENGHVVGTEALLRWNIPRAASSRPTRRFRSPSAPLAPPVSRWSATAGTTCSSAGPRRVMFTK